MLSGVLGRFRAGGDSPSPPRRQTSGGDGGGVGAVKWIRVQDGGRGTEPQMVVSDEASREVLRPLGSKKPLNMVAIMGAARQGKSFLMNQLARKDDVFRISNAKEPCTQGVDISRAVLPCDAFYPRAKNGPMVALVDVEGQGDRSVDHDARLATSILPLCRCVIFNWKDSLQVDRILNLLAVLQHASHNIDMEHSGGEQQTHRVFGHLHIVMRDWQYTGSKEDVWRQLLEPEKRAITPDAAVRNELRRTLKESFESISVWLLPPPTEATKDLSRQLCARDLSDTFVQGVDSLRLALGEQLVDPTTFGGRVLSGELLAGIVPALVDVLNKGQVVLPTGAYAAMMTQEADSLLHKSVEKAEEMFKAAKHACDQNPSDRAFTSKEVQAANAHFVEEFETRAYEVGVPDEIIIEKVDALQLHLDKGIAAVLAHNDAALAKHLKAARQRAAAHFKSNFGDAAQCAMPMELTALDRLYDRALGEAMAMLKAVKADNSTTTEEIDELRTFCEMHKRTVSAENTYALQQREVLALRAREAAEAKFASSHAQAEARRAEDEARSRATAAERDALRAEQQAQVRAAAADAHARRIEQGAMSRAARAAEMEAEAILVEEQARIRMARAAAASPPAWAPPSPPEVMDVSPPALTRSKRKRPLEEPSEVGPGRRQTVLGIGAGPSTSPEALERKRLEAQEIIASKQTKTKTTGRTAVDKARDEARMKINEEQERSQARLRTSFSEDNLKIAASAAAAMDNMDEEEVEEEEEENTERTVEGRHPRAKRVKRDSGSENLQKAREEAQQAIQQQAERAAAALQGAASAVADPSPGKQTDKARKRQESRAKAKQWAEQEMKKKKQKNT